MKISELIAQRAEIKMGGKPPEDRPRKPVAQRALKVIRTRETPNPNALQFVLNTQVLEKGKRSYASKEECKEDVMATAVFGFEAIQNVYIMDNFVTVTKGDRFGWNPLKKQVWDKIDELVKVYPSDEADVGPQIDVTNFLALPQDEKLQAIEMILNRSIRSQLAQDGGGVDLMGLDDNEVKIHYQGACGSCPTSTTGTLQAIEKLIKQQLDRSLVVKSV